MKAGVPPFAAFPVRAPVIALAIMTVVAVRLQEFFPILAIIKPVLLVAVVGTAFLFVSSRASVRKAILQEPLARLVLTYYCWVLFTIPFALWSGLAFGNSKTLLPAILMFLSLMFVAPRRRHLDWLQTGFVFLVMAYAVYAQVFGRIGGGGRMRGLGGMYDSNDMASLMAIAFPLAAGLVVRSSSTRSRAIAAFASVAVVLTAISSGSRGGTLGLIAGAIVFALGQKGVRGMLTVMALAGGLSIAWVTAPESFQARMLSLGDIENDYNYTDQYGRKAVWERGRGYIRANPLVGVGVGNFPVAEGGTWEDLNRGGKWSAAHNAYIQAAAELGVFGGSLFVLLLLTAGWHAFGFFRADPQSRGPPGRIYRPELLASLAAFAVGAYFLSHAYFPPLFALLGIVALAARTARAEASSSMTYDAPVATPARAPGQRGGLAYRQPVNQRVSLRESR